jgi:hypothetical protein
MTKVELFEKNSIAHCFLFSSTNPNTLIPVKVFIKDVKFYESNPKYLVKIMKFYDSVHFLKGSLFNRPFQTKFDTRSRILNFSKTDFKSTESIIEYMYENDDSKYYFVVESINMVKYKKELIDLFNKLQDFFIIRSIKEWRSHSNRSLYSGKFNMSSKTEFHNRLKSMIADRVGRGESDFEDFVDLIS